MACLIVGQLTPQKFENGKTYMGLLPLTDERLDRVELVDGVPTDTSLKAVARKLTIDLCNLCQQRGQVGHCDTAIPSSALSLVFDEDNPGSIIPILDLSRMFPKPPLD